MPAYYNEFDPYAAQWLRNLIAAGHIAPGDVDGRDIREVSPNDIQGYDQCHFFAGIGGWSYALRLAGWPDDRPVWSASCPCPPFSVAGKQAKCPECKSACLVWCPRRTGYAICVDCENAWLADARHLWPEVWRLASESRPGRIFGEQVDSVAALDWLSAVSASLEILGYTIGAEGLPASSVGAPHIRQRLWWVADAKRNQRETRRPPDQFRECSAPEGVGAHAESGRRSAVGGLDDTPSARCEPKGRGKPEEPQGRGCLLGVGCEDGGVGDTDQPRPQGRRERSDECADQQAPWAAGEFIPCDDDKARPIGTRIQWMVDGFSGIMDEVCSIQEEVIDAKKAVARPDQALSNMRGEIVPQKVPGWEAGRSDGIREEGILRPDLHGARIRRNGQSPEREEFPTPISEDPGGGLRALPGNSGPSCPPYRRKPDEQQSVEPGDVMRFLSSALASPTWQGDLDACGAMPHLRSAAQGLGILPEALSALPEIWRSISDETKGRIARSIAGTARWQFINPLSSERRSGRTGMIRAFGNAVVPECAAEFIRTRPDVMAAK